jgi:hypothetical protein
MAKVHASIMLPATAQSVWATIGEFGGIDKWHPAVRKSEQSESGGTVTRSLDLHGGGVILERLETKDDEGKTYSYSILEGPLPVANYKSTLLVTENADRRSCTVEWSSEFTASGAPEAEAVGIVRGIYEAGFESLRTMFRPSAAG